MPTEQKGNTPMFQHYHSIKAEYPDVLLLMRVGDFFEAYNEDAEIIAHDLNMTLTGRNDGEVRVPMVGIPYYMVERVVSKLTLDGHSVAILEIKVQESGRVLREVNFV